MDFEVAKKVDNIKVKAHNENLVKISNLIKKQEFLKFT